ncbi:hypothetical protein CBR_g34233 [Chara braunii]|uniref:Reverse transcriptase domain-containing protein n=1 Tax=Chara braunii TaxID=69332 RepID=A0A388JYL5_CHABU|nr:hypothetical protein CBR_g34233 [Chara braunii]|eukprot:GBG62862.1 hypothetical protein CBR_g34233 [Chara braunii]
MVDTRTGKSTAPSEAEQARIAALLREKKEKRELLKQAKLKAIAEEQAAKKKKLDEEMLRFQKEKMLMLQQEEEERRKAAEEEAAAEEEEEEKEEPLERKRGEQRGESSGTKEEDRWREKKISEWVANLSLGEDEEAQLYVPQEEREAFARALKLIEDPLELQATEDEKKLEWKLKMMREKKRRREEASRIAGEVERWRSAKALKAVMDDLVAVPDHGVTETQLVQLFYFAMPEPLRRHFFDKTQQPNITYDTLSREVVLFEAKSMPVSTFWHKDLDKGKKWKGRTISGQVRAKDHLILTLDEGSTDEVPYSQIEWGLEEEDSGAVKKEQLEDQVFVVYVRPVTEPKQEDSSMDPAIAKLLEGFKDLTEPPTGVVSRPIQHRIEIEPDSRTPKGAVYRMSPRELEELRKQLDELLEKGWIRPSSSPFGAPVLFVPKKEGELRMCIDYRGLNAITVKNVEPLPRIDDVLDRVQGCKYFLKIDLKSGYHQIEVHLDDQYKTAFRTRYGHYEFIVMPFGLTNVPMTFQRCMNDLFRPWLDRFVVIYLDDILVFSRTLQEHQGHLRQVLEKLREANFKINAKKCEWVKTQVLYLGHVLDGDGIKPEDSKIAAIRDWSMPRTLTELRSFLGLPNYYRKFVRNFSTIAAPLRKLLKKEAIWQWDKDYTSALKKLKRALIEYPVLKVVDPSLLFVVTTDAIRRECAIQHEKEIATVVENLRKAQHRMIEQANKHRRPSQFQVGDLVWVKSKEFAPEENISQKLLPAYKGPWPVLEVKGGEDGPSYTIEIPSHLHTYPIFHASKLLPCVTSQQFPSRRSMIPPDMDGRYDIDGIVGEDVFRTGGRGRPQKHYKVRFAYQEPEDDRWFTRAELLEIVPDIVRAYERDKKGKGPALD